MSLEVKKGYLSLYYCYDVAEEIFLDKIENILGTTPQKISLKYTRITPHYIQYRHSPLFIDLGFQQFGNDKLECSAKIYDFGVITIRLSLHMENINAEDLALLSKQYVSNSKVEQLARLNLNKIKAEIGSAIEPSSIVTEDSWEDYSIFFVHEFKQDIKGHDILAKNKELLAKILKSETEKLSKFEQEDATKYFISYYENDMTIIDWNAAFIYDKQIGYDNLDVIEYAVIELLELRTYDTYLDKVLDNAYDDLSQRRVSGKTLKKLTKIRLGVSEVVEKVENSLKLIGDLYLAKVYNTAAARFYLDKWKGSVKGKLDTIQNMYEMLYEKKQSSRMMTLEVLMALFFAIDIVLILIEVILLRR